MHHRTCPPLYAALLLLLVAIGVAATPHALAQAAPSRATGTPGTDRAPPPEGPANIVIEGNTIVDMIPVNPVNAPGAALAGRPAFCSSPCPLALPQTGDGMQLAPTSHRRSTFGSAVLSLSITVCALLASARAPLDAQQRPRLMLVVHGGAGTIRPRDMTPAEEAAYRAKLTEAIRAGYAILDNGGRSLDAVVAVIKVLEDSPLFNAGKGAVFTSAGTNELDAAIMDGRTLAAGAVAGVKHIKNPIELARLVMEKSGHVMLAGAGAEAFAKSQGMRLVPQRYFFTERRWEQLQRAKAAEKADEAGGGSGRGGRARRGVLGTQQGTVGAVALDSHGDLAAATSTGGTTNKRWGRVGDSPIIGAGTYANNASCAVSATGTGEFFIRNVVAHDICARLAYKGVSLERAAHEVVMQELVEQHGDGGVVAVDKDGNIAMPFNTEGMYRGYVGPDGKIVVQIYKE